MRTEGTSGHRMGVYLTIALALVVGGALLWRLGSGGQGRDCDGRLIDMAEKAISRADRAKSAECDVLLSASRWRLAAIVAAAAVPLGIAYLVLREITRSDPQAEEIVHEVEQVILWKEHEGDLPFPPNRGQLAGPGKALADGASDDARNPERRE